MFSGLDDKSKENIVTVLGRRAMRRPSDRHLLASALLRFPDVLGPRAVPVALELGASVVLAIEEALDRDDPAASDLARFIERHLPWPTSSLQSVADKVMTLVMSGTDQGTDMRRVENLANLAIRRRDMGRFEEALAAGSEALALLQSTSEPGADETKFATVIVNNLVCLTDLGRYEEAARLGEEGRRLLDDIPSQARDEQHEVHRARIVSNAALGRFFSGTAEGVIEDTRWAIGVFDREFTVGRSTFRVELARTRSNLSMFLSHLQQPREAYRVAAAAVRTARDAVDADPDKSLPELALALEGLADRARTLERPKHAVAASKTLIEIYENLTARFLAEYGRRLAAALSNHTIYLAESGGGVEEVEFARRAVQILEQIHCQQPNSVDEELAVSYCSLAGAILEQGDDDADEAIDAIENAAITIRRCSVIGSGLRLAAILINKADTLDRLGKKPEATKARREAGETFERLSLPEREAVPGVAQAIASRLDLDRGGERG